MKLMVRWRALLPVLLAAALVVFLATGPLRPLTDEERVREVFDDWVEANLDRDFGRVWDLMGEAARDDIRASLADWHARPPSDPEWVGLVERTGLGPEDVEGLDARSFYVTAQEGGVRLHPEVYDEIRRKLGALRIEELGIEADRARLLCYDDGLPGISSMLLFFEREEGRWRTHQIIDCTMSFRTLARKLECFLPPAKVEPSEVAIIIGLGPERPDSDEIEPLGRLLEAVLRLCQEDAVVLIEPSPSTPWQGVVDIVDAAMLARVGSIAFAACGEQDLPPGIRLNGVPLLEFVDSTENPVPLDHPALSRIIGLSQR